MAVELNKIVEHSRREMDKERLLTEANAVNIEENKRGQ